MKTLKIPLFIKLNNKFLKFVKDCRLSMGYGSLILSGLVVGCTSHNYKRDDHSYVYVYQHYDTPQNTQITNKLKPEKPDQFEDKQTNNQFKSFDTYQMPPKYNSAVISDEAFVNNPTKAPSAYISPHDYRINKYAPYPYYGPRVGD